jgi:hypothetical protein
MIHWSEGKVTLEQGFDNERIMRPSSVNLRRIESSLWKRFRERWVLKFTSKFGSFCDGYFDALATLCRGYCDES